MYQYRVKSTPYVINVRGNRVNKPVVFLTVYAEDIQAMRVKLNEALGYYRRSEDVIESVEQILTETPEGFECDCDGDCLVV